MRPSNFALKMSDTPNMAGGRRLTGRDIMPEVRDALTGREIEDDDVKTRLRVRAADPARRRRAQIAFPESRRSHTPSHQRSPRRVA